MEDYSIMLLFVNLETYFKKFFFLLDFTNENKYHQEQKKNRIKEKTSYWN